MTDDQHQTVKHFGTKFEVETARGNIDFSETMKVVAPKLQIIDIIGDFHRGSLIKSFFGSPAEMHLDFIREVESLQFLFIQKLMG